MDFLDLLIAPLASPEEPIESNRPWCLASFLIQLSFFDADLHYQFPHAVLAASAACVALSTLKAAPSLYAGLLEDTTRACSMEADVPVQVAACSASLLALWQASAASGFQHSTSILRKFGRLHLDANMLLRPPRHVDLLSLAVMMNADPNGPGHTQQTAVPAIAEPCRAHFREASSTCFQSGASFVI
jgi:hypothetical protein